MLPSQGAARHREDLAVLFERHPGGDQRAAFLSRLNDYDPEAEPRYEAVAGREVLGHRWRSDRQFADDRAAALDNRLGQFAMLGRVDDVDAASHHGERFAVSVERTLMRLAVDSARQTAHDGEALGRQLEAEPLRHPAAGVAGSARADDCEASGLGADEAGPRTNRYGGGSAISRRLGG